MDCLRCIQVKLILNYKFLPKSLLTQPEIEDVYFSTKNDDEEPNLLNRKGFVIL